MKEIINIHIGQAGVRIGNACWELFCREHHIQPDGAVPENDNKDFSDNSMHSSFFFEDSKGNYTPRSLFVDLESSIVDEIRIGSHRRLFNPEFLVSGKEDSSNNFIRGSYTIGKEVIDPALDKIQKLVETCDNLEGFIITHSIIGGTGSGFCDNIIARLSVDYGKKMKQCFTVFPSPDISDTVVEPYNAVMSMGFLLEHADSVVMLDNQALYNLCSEHLDIESPNYTNVNPLIAQLISSSTVSMRFSGSSLNYDLREFHTNLVPFPRLHFLAPSLAPIIDINRAYHRQPDLAKITESALKPGSSFISYEAYKGKYLACSLIYRGDVTPKEIITAVNEAKAQRDMNFISWVPTGFKTGICSKAMIENEDMRAVSRSLCMMSNNTAVTKVWKGIAHKYTKMADRRAFVHWYVGEGIDDESFFVGREELHALVAEYEEIQNNNFPGSGSETG